MVVEMMRKTAVSVTACTAREWLQEQIVGGCQKGKSGGRSQIIITAEEQTVFVSVDFIQHYLLGNGRFPHPVTVTNLQPVLILCEKNAPSS